MKKPLHIARRAALLGAALLTPAWVFAQTAPSTAPKESTSSTTQPAPAATDDDEMVVLSPFTVTTTADSDTYQVQDTLAGTRVKTKLSDLGSAITVINSKFMSDIQGNNAQSLLQYTTNTEVGGLRGNFGGMGNGATISESNRLLQPDTNTRVRGLTSADNTRNYFTSSIPWDGFNIDRVDMQRGPNAMLFGNGSPAGIINTSLNDAMFKNQIKVQNRVGEYGSMRNILDVNYVLLPKELAIRVVGLDDNTKYEQMGTFNHQKRVYAALSYNPKWLDFPGAHTEIKINDENGKTISRNPRTLTPLDGITPWYSALEQITVNPFTLRQTNNPVIADKTSDRYAYLYGSSQGRILWSNMVYSFANPNSTQVDVLQAGQVSTFNGIGQGNPTVGLPTSTTWPQTKKIASIGFAEPAALNSYSNYAAYKGLLGASLGEYRDKLLTDPTIFDFYKNTLDGPNTHQYQNWNGFNASLSQTFLDNRIGLNLSFYAEHYKYGGEDYLAGSNYALNVDINTVNAYWVSDPATPVDVTSKTDRRVNQNLGRPYISTDGSGGNFEGRDQRDSSRAQLYGDLRSSDFISNPRLQEILGHHQFTAVVSKDAKSSTNMSWTRWNATSDWVNTVGTNKNISGGDRNIDMVSYVGPSLLGTTSASGHNIGGLTVIQQPGSTVTASYFDSHWKASLNPTDPGFINPNLAYTLPDWVVAYQNPDLTAWNSNQSQNIANYKGWTSSSFNLLNADKGDINQLYTNGSKARTVIKSQAFTWQGFMFGDTLVPAFGWRKDKVTLAQKSAPVLDTAQGLVDPFNYTPGEIIARDEQQSRTWSLVYKLPKTVKKYIPQGMDLNLFYNKSSNFEAQAIRKDYLGGTIPNASGKTTEYGFVVSALDGKMSLKVNWYDTKVKDATLNGANLGAKAYELALLPAWGVATAAQAYAGVTNTTIDNGTSVQDKPWFWDYAWAAGAGYGVQPRPTSGTYHDIDVAELASIKAFADNSMPQSFYDTWGMPVNVAAMQAGDWNHAITQSGYVSSGGGSIQSSNGNTANGVAPSITVDTESKGMEFEFYAQPIRNLNITVNASKDTSTNTNLSGTMIKIINMEKALYDSAAGDLHLWSANGEKFRSIFYRDIYGPYLNYLAQENTQVPELRPWHVNAIASYTFDKGFVKGVSVGGAYHWAQGQILGYHLDERATLPDGSANPKYGFLDVNNPWKGSSEHSFDLWVGYKRDLGRKLTWEIQLNVSAVGQKHHLTPISVEPNDGSWAEVRIVSGQSWYLTNTFKF